MYVFHLIEKSEVAFCDTYAGYSRKYCTLQTKEKNYLDVGIGGIFDDGGESICDVVSMTLVR